MNAETRLGSPTLQQELNASANLLEQTKKLLNSSDSREKFATMTRNVSTKINGEGVPLQSKPTNVMVTPDINNLLSTEKKRTTLAPKATKNRNILPVKRDSQSQMETPTEPKRKNPSRESTDTMKGAIPENKSKDEANSPLEKIMTKGEPFAKKAKKSRNSKEETGKTTPADVRTKYVFFAEENKRVSSGEITKFLDEKKKIPSLLTESTNHSPKHESAPPLL